MSCFSSTELVIIKYCSKNLSKLGRPNRPRLTLSHEMIVLILILVNY